MSTELSQIFFLGLAYLSTLFAIAYVADRGLIPERLIHHPVIYILSLGVIAGAWAVFGMVDLAARYGFSYLSFFFGVSTLFMFGSLILAPAARISIRYQLRSLPDMLAFRYRSQWAGTILTISMLLVMLPLFALQITAVSDTVYIINQGGMENYSKENTQAGLAFTFCCVISLFTVLFGARHVGTQERHNGLIAAIAFESISKLVVLLIIGAVCLFQVFDGPQGLQVWLENNSELTRSLRTGNNGDNMRYFLLLFFMAALLMPHSFHMLFAERPTARAMRAASWGFPLYLLLMSIPVLVILWASKALGIAVPLQYAVTGISISLESPNLQLLAYIGGLSAASSVIIVATQALASMCLNHLVLAVYQPDTKDIYRWLLWVRRLLIIGIILMSYLFYRIVSAQHDLASLGIASFSGVLQFMPGVLAMLYWPEANRNGFIGGLIVGLIIWFFTVLLPMLQPESAALVGTILPDELRSTPSWQTGTITALGANTLLFIAGSLLIEQTEEEQMAAEICSMDELNRPVRRALDVHSPAEMKDRLTIDLGRNTAERELSNALAALKMDKTESRPYALRRLREKIEANLSGLLGPSSAYEIINRRLPFVLAEDGEATEDIQFVESRLEGYQVELTGLAAELDSLRRYHRETLQALPVGVCIVGADREITMWNAAMEDITGINGAQVVGSALHGIKQPWSDVISNFAESNQDHRFKKHIVDSGDSRWISLHKATLAADEHSSRSQAIVIEDITETQVLEQELTHSERLASVGRLAAGVAHEIGNPVTGIACIAQNLASEYENDPEVRSSSKDILEQTQRVSAIVQSLVNFSHSGEQSAEIPFTAVALRDCINDSIQLLQLNKEARQVTYEVDIGSDIDLHGDAQRLAQVFINLLSNARDASPENGTVWVKASTEEARVIIEVIDEGGGIDRSVQEQIFEPFFTTKQAGDGTGLGLSVAYSIIEDHSGSIQLDSPVNPSAGTGTRFVLKLPRYMGYN